MIEDFTGFVYIIVDTITDKKYVGQKLFISTRTKMVNGKKKKVKSISDYKNYWGSNLELQEEVKKNGPDRYKREMLYLCKSKGTMNYLELVEQVDRRVLEKPDEYWNGFIGGKIHRKHVKL
jgi:hypothetical protein